MLSRTSTFVRCLDSLKTSIRCNSTFYHKDLSIQLSDKKPNLPEDGNYGFGTCFTKHMITVDWCAEKGWKNPELKPLDNIALHPAAKVFHYAVELFEGMKAYRGVDDKIRLFRPEMNMQRMRRSAIRSCLPSFDENEAVKLIAELVKTEKDLLPKSMNTSLYIRPFMMGTDPSLGVCEPRQAQWICITSLVNGYFDYDKGLRLLSDPQYVRSWTGGVGQYKMGSNYAPTIYVQKEASKEKFDQVIWLSGEDRLVTEAGAMNLFVFWKNEQGVDELITAPIESGLLLPGITRMSVLDLAREWNEFKVSEKDYTMAELTRAAKENRVYEVFAAGTAAIVGPVSEIVYRDAERGIDENLKVPTTESKHGLYRRFLDTLTGIQYGKVQKKEWQYLIE